VSDRDAILAIVADHERGFNAKDPELLAAHYREPSWVVSARGAEVEGPAAILEQARNVPADQYARFEPGHVEFLGGDVAILHVYVRATDADGAPRDVGHRMIALYVFARAGGAWEVVARQDTLTS
jgi:uncharacterized protein (TIGR02246 family)